MVTTALLARRGTRLAGAGLGRRRLDDRGVGAVDNVGPYVLAR